MNFIPYGKQYIDENDINQVTRVLCSDWLTQGPNIENFEKEVAKYCGAKYAVAVCNATAALHISCLAAELGSDDVLWTSPNTFLASANCALYCGANIDFVDIDPETYNMSEIKLAEKLELTKKSGKQLPKIVIPVHFAGQSCNMEQIHALSKEYGFTIIEDASHAIGGSYKNKKIGCCQFADMAVFSFHPVKIITTGEGGIVLTNDKHLFEQLLLFRCHGMTRDSSLMENEPDGPWYYEQVDLGYNYRITDIQAALGLSQMGKLDEFILKRHQLVERYKKGLINLPLITPWQNPDTFSAFHLYVIRLQLEKITNNRKEVFEALRKANIGVNVHYIPVHTQPYYRDLGFKWGDFPEAEKYYQEAITLPLYYSLSFEEQDYIIETLKVILK